MIFSRGGMVKIQFPPGKNPSTGCFSGLFRSFRPTPRFSRTTPLFFRGPSSSRIHPAELPEPYEKTRPLT